VNKMIISRFVCCEIRSRQINTAIAIVAIYTFLFLLNRTVKMCGITHAKVWQRQSFTTPEAPKQTVRHSKSK